MQRNAEKCEHCGKPFPRLSVKIPIVNRSTESFHVSLFSGPDTRPKFSGGFYDDQVICDFTYIHNDLGAKEYTVLVVMAHAKHHPEEVLG